MSMFSSILTSSAMLSQLQSMSAANTRVHGEMEIIKSELKLDRGSVAKKKEEQLDRLQEKSESITQQMTQSLNDVNAELQKPADSGKDPITELLPEEDSVEISQEAKDSASAAASGEQEAEKAEKPAERVVYTKDSSAKKADAKPAGNRVDVKL